ncbi:MAG: hypothetical protein DI570_15685 [Phenylobacterium zucineum]|nr:MAG: hypothetical protein DI570_15685 [Phenylobacterium zucineum]
MKTLILPLTAALALTAGAAAAQPYGYGAGYDRGGWTPIERRLERLDHRIDQGVRSGQLTRREADRLRDQFYGVARLEARYSRNGLSNWERQDLDRRFDQLSRQIRWERSDRDRRYGWNDYPRY